jgi:hypothetical protein
VPKTRAARDAAGHWRPGRWPGPKSGPKKDQAILLAATGLALNRIIASASDF